MGSEDKSERALFPWGIPPVQEVLGGEHSGSSVTALGPNNPLLSPRDRPCTADTCSKREVTVHAASQVERQLPPRGCRRIYSSSRRRSCWTCRPHHVLYSSCQPRSRRLRRAAKQSQGPGETPHSRPAGL